MGFPIKFNWVLQCDIPSVLKNGDKYPFVKDGNRVFPIDTPIDLIDTNRNAVAKIKVKRFTNEPLKTSGEFEVVKIYSGNEKDVLSNYWIENQ